MPSIETEQANRDLGIFKPQGPEKAIHYERTTDFSQAEKKYRTHNDTMRLYHLACQLL
jgi:hypothetical protein